MKNRFQRTKLSYRSNQTRRENPKGTMKPKTPSVEVSRSFDGKHIIHYNDASHRYKMDGEAVSGTTTVIDAGFPTSYNLIRWAKGQAAEYIFDTLTKGDKKIFTKEERIQLIEKAKNISEEKKKDAGAVGTLVHDYCHKIEIGKADEAQELLNKIAELPTDTKLQILNSISKFKEFKRTNDDKLELAETLVGSPTLGICGKFDKLSRMSNGMLVLDDYKSSKNYYLKHFIQLALYRRQIKEWLGLDVSAIRVLLFSKEDGELKKPLMISDPKELKMFEDAGIRSLENHQFLKLNNDDRFNYKKQ